MRAALMLPTTVPMASPRTGRRQERALKVVQALRHPRRARQPQGPVE